jgi:hypothetical protein
MSGSINSIANYSIASLRYALAGVLFCVAGHLAAQTMAREIPVPLPPMGWSSWNSFSNSVDSTIIMNQARAMAANGMQKAGYQYINIDEGWWLGKRDKDGNIIVDPKAWPALASGEHDGDMANIARYIHGLGLKAGIYTDAGLNGCSTVGPDLGPSIPFTGSEGHYEQDFLQFAQWGFDYVKVDWCGGVKENLDPAVQYAEIARAIGRAETITGHRLYFSICNWGKDSPSTWAPNIGGVAADIWRTGGDIVAPIVANTKNADRKAEFKEVLREFDQAQHPEAQHTGFYNDPDMMVVGMPGLTDEQNRAHMSLWAISGGPLLVGADLTRLSAADLATLTNPDVLRVDQDSLGLQCIKVANAAPGLEVWAKPLSAQGEYALLLLNRTASTAPITVTWSDLGLRPDSSATVRDIWAQSNLGTFTSSYSAPVPAHDVVLLLITGSESASTTYLPQTGNRNAAVLHSAMPEQHFANVVSKFPVARIRVTYTNPGPTTSFAELRVNGQIATRIAFPPTASTAGTISIESGLETDGAENTLNFSVHGGQELTIRSIALQ